METFSATSGAVKPPIDAATSTTSSRPSMAETTRLAYSGQAGVGIGTRQRNGDRLVASGLEQRDNSVPVPGVPARTGNQDVRTHDTRMNSRRGRRCQRAASSGTTFPGHYAAHEATGVLVADIREFFAGR